MVSTCKGYGSLVLRELEKCLILLADSENIACRLINVMSVEATSARFERTGNVRMVKAIGDFGLESARIGAQIQSSYFVVSCPVGAKFWRDMLTYRRR